jgi:ATP-dependent HslUV protease ATP-binding subunit HslU
MMRIVSVAKAARSCNVRVLSRTRAFLPNSTNGSVLRSISSFQLNNDDVKQSNSRDGTRLSSAVVVANTKIQLSRFFSSPAAVATAPPSSHAAFDAQQQEHLEKEDNDPLNLKPSQVVAGLDLHIVGQADAKRAVAIAMRNRWRRQQLPLELRKEITPRNVLLVGPTGCGKTEVARRMAKLNHAPFLKVEATKFTEVGYHGRDVDSIIRDLVDVSMQLTRTQYLEKFRAQAQRRVTELLLDQLAGPATTSVTTADASSTNTNETGASKQESSEDSTTTASTTSTMRGSANRGRESFRDMLQQGMLDDQEIEVEVPKGGLDKQGGSGGPTIVTSSSSDHDHSQVTAAVTEIWARMSGGTASGSGSKKHATERKRLSIAVARELLEQVELEKLLETVDLKKEAITAVEESGIVFIDEIDKICSARDGYSGSGRSADASAEGVQRDLLPLIEGTTISTKYGNVNTDFILFVASGAFHAVKPSDLLPELQGRLPIRVELKGLTEDDLYRILTEPVANLVRQQIDMIATEGVTLTFEDEAIREMARMAAMLNKTVENIGARRLHTVMERIMEELSFAAAELERGAHLVVDKALVERRLADVVKKTDISKYIL